ncbi:hypothetical protein DSM25559_4355 [Agrobacterium rosae]|uniref:Uncharacterized protein n=1 Tax=Agrobacterium rosae TaxID=1972867 RepID=A0A1R3U0V9_9HYPH|nr:hypothetical protein DSM25559_4355 [Agrobacterium rosae]
MEQRTRPSATRTCRTRSRKTLDRISLETLNAFIADRDVDVHFSAQTELFRRHQGKLTQDAEPAQGTLGFE